MGMAAAQTHLVLDIGTFRYSEQWHAMVIQQMVGYDLRNIVGKEASTLI